MTSNNQDFFNHTVGPFLISITNEINKIADSIEEHSTIAASFLRETLNSSPWLPDSIKPPPPPPASVISKTPRGYLEASQDWISEHRAVTAAVVAFVSTGVFIIWRRRRLDQIKRRAKRSKYGAKTEVIVLAGSPYSPLTRSLSIDLERRGFIIYIPVRNISETHLVQSEERADIRPLDLDITSQSSTAETLHKFTTHLLTPQNPPPTRPNDPDHTLHLASLVFIPSGIGPNSTYPTTPIAAITASTWSDTLNTHVLAPFTTLQAFLPLITAQKSSLLLLTPTITPSLTPPFHAPESVVAGALQNYISTLRKETKELDINIVQFKLGTFDYGSAPGGRQQIAQIRAPGSEAQEEVRSWDAATQSRYGKDYLARTRGWQDNVKSCSLRELHNAVFDAIVREKGKGGTVFVGSGSWMYDFVGKWVPGGVVGWMLRARSKGVEVVEKLDEEVEGGAGSDSDGSYERVYA